MASDYKVTIGAETTQAIKDVADFSKSTNDELNKLSKNVESLKFLEIFHVGFEVASEALHLFGEGLEKVTEILKEAVGAALQEEAAIQKLNVALGVAGTFSKESSHEFIEFAEHLQETANVSKNAVIESLALSTQFGLTGEQAKKLATAAVELSAVTGQDLRTSTDQLTRSYLGFTRGLDKTVPGIKSLSVEALGAGGAIDLLNGRLSGVAEQLTNNFGGAVKAARFAQEELFVSIGKVITQNPIFIDAIKEVAKIFNDLRRIVENNKEVIINFVIDGISAFLNLGKALLTVVDFVDAAFTKLSNGVKFFVSGIVAVQQTIAGNSAGAIEAINAANDDITKSNSDLEQRSKLYSDLTGKVSQFSSSISNSAKAAVEAGQTDIAIAGERGAAQKALNDEINKNTEAYKRQIKEFTQATVQAASKGGSGSLLQPLQLPKDIKLDEEQRNQLENKRIAGAVLGDVSNVLKGAEGAVALTSTLVGQFADTIIPGIGGVVSQIFQVFAQGPEKVKQMVEGFVTAIPEIIKNIILASASLDAILIRAIPKFINAFIEAIPQIVEAQIRGFIDAIDAIVEAVPQIIDAIINKVPEIIQSILSDVPQIINKLVSEIPRVINALINLMGPVSIRFAQELVIRIPFIVASFAFEFVKSVPRIIASIADGVASAIRDAVKGLGNIFGGGDGGGIGGVVSDVGSFLGFAEGGIVPAGFNNDNFPARLTSGENIIDRSQNQRLNRFLNSQEGGGGFNTLIEEVRQLRSALASGGSQNLSLSLNVGEKQLADTMLNLNRQGFRTA